MHPKHCSDYPKSCKKRNRILHHISSFDRQAEKNCKLMVLWYFTCKNYYLYAEEKSKFITQRSNLARFNARILPPPFFLKAKLLYYWGRSICQSVAESS